MVTFHTSVTLGVQTFASRKFREVKKSLIFYIKFRELDKKKFSEHHFRDLLCSEFSKAQTFTKKAKSRESFHT